MLFWCFNCNKNVVAISKGGGPLCCPHCLQVIPIKVETLGEEKKDK